MKRNCPAKRAGLVFAIATMDRYGYPIGVIAGVLGVSKSTVHRRRPRLRRRESGPVGPYRIARAKKIVLDEMLEADFAVAVIMSVLNVTKDTVYRRNNHLWNLKAKAQVDRQEWINERLLDDPAALDEMDY